MLDPDVKKDLKYYLRLYRDQIKEKYAAFVTSLCTAVIATQVSLRDFRLYVLGLSAFQDQDGEQPNLLDDVKKAKIEEAGSIHRIFEVLTTECCSFLHIGIFQSIIKKYDIKTDSEDLKYSEHLKAYIDKHKISEFLEVIPRLDIFLASSNGNQKKLTLKFDVNLPVKVTHVFDLETTIAGILELSPSALRLVSIEKGCVVVTFQIPEAVADYLSKISLTENQKAEINALSIKWLKCEDVVLYSRVKDYKGKTTRAHIQYSSHLSIFKPIPIQSEANS